MFGITICITIYKIDIQQGLTTEHRGYTQYFVISYTRSLSLSIKWIDKLAVMTGIIFQCLNGNVGAEAYYSVFHF